MMRDEIFIDCDTGRHTVENRADGISVAFAEECDGDAFAKGVFLFANASLMV